MRHRQEVNVTETSRTDRSPRAPDQGARAPGRRRPRRSRRHRCPRACASSARSSASTRWRSIGTSGTRTTSSTASSTRSSPSRDRRGRRPAGDWKTALRAQSIAARQVMLRHPWAPRAIVDRTTTSPTMLVYIESVLGEARRWRVLGRDGPPRAPCPRQPHPRVHAGPVRGLGRPRPVTGGVGRDRAGRWPTASRASPSWRCR